MAKQLHKRFSNEEVKAVFEKYKSRVFQLEDCLSFLKIRRRQFFVLFQEYRKNPEDFSIEFKRSIAPRIVDPKSEKKILNELKKEAALIEDKRNPIRFFNYSYLKEVLEEKHGVRVSLPTIISRAKKNGYYQERKKSKIHDREVLTHYAGQLVQHDTSIHVYSPAAGVYWYLISSLDDFSRRILYGDLLDHESSWLHIMAVKSLVMEFGCPKAYYPDSHSIFRYVEKRDTIHRKFEKTQEEASVQWAEVLKDLNIEIIYAGSPQAKGKVERSYRWIQDHLVRICARENITRIEEAREILYQELYQYNYKRVHSTTGEVPGIRFERAIKEGKSFFRSPTLKAPYQSWEDIFCYRYQRVADSYRKVYWNNQELPVHTDPRRNVELRVSFDPKTKRVKVRVWDQNKLVGEYLLKQTEIKKVHF